MVCLRSGSCLPAEWIQREAWQLLSLLTACCFLEGARIICITIKMCCLWKSYSEHQKSNCKANPAARGKAAQWKEMQGRKQWSSWKQSWAQQGPRRGSWTLRLNMEGGVRQASPPWPYFPSLPTGRNSPHLPPPASQKKSHPSCCPHSKFCL